MNTLQAFDTFWQANNSGKIPIGGGLGIEASAILDTLLNE